MFQLNLAELGYNYYIICFYFILCHKEITDGEYSESEGNNLQRHFSPEGHYGHERPIKLSYGIKCIRWNNNNYGSVA